MKQTATATRTPQEKFTLVYEAVKRTLLSYEILLKRIEQELKPLSISIELGAEVGGEDAAAAFISAMGLVDFAYRYAQLVDSLPLVNKKASEMRALKLALGPAEPARHHLQHMRGDLNVSGGIDYPLLGQLAWENGSKCFTLSFSEAKATHHTLTYDRLENSYVTPLMYFLKHVELDLGAMHNAMKVNFDWLQKWAVFDPPEFGELRWGSTFGLWSSVNLVRR